jgi:uncharacterized protein YdaU (DUF1376 family)
MNYYSHHIGDFDKATRHLTRLERSIYRDLIELYYDTEQPLTLDIPTLCRKVIAKSNEESTSVEQTLNEFFTKTATGWYHDRCEKELDAYRNSTSQKSLAGKASDIKKELKRQQAINGESTGVERALNGTSTNQEPITNNQEPITNNHIKPAAPADDLQADFDQAWALYPKRPGASKPDSLKAYKARIKAGSSVSEIVEGVIRYAAFVAASHTDAQYIKQPATFFGPGDHFKAKWDFVVKPAAGVTDLAATNARNNEEARIRLFGHRKVEAIDA